MNTILKKSVSLILIISLILGNNLISNKENIKAEEIEDSISQDYGLENPRIEDDATTASGTKAVWDCIYFGSYPQTELSSDDPEYISAKAIPSSQRDSNRDVTVDGEKYHFADKSDATATGTGYSWDSGTHCFKYEPIKWRVLKVEDGKALLLSDVVLDCKPLAESGSISTSVTTTKYFDLMMWLNGESNATYDHSEKNFINYAFSETEQESILESTHNSGNTNGLLSHAKIGQKIFLLSDCDLYDTEAAVSFGFAQDKDLYDEARQCKASDFAYAMGILRYSKYNESCFWWTRSSGAFVYPWGKLTNTDSVIGTNNGVRVAIEIDLSTAEWEKAESVHTGEHNWTNEVITKKPTLDEPGIRTYYCEYGDAKEEEIEKLTSSCIEDYVISLSETEYVYDGTEKKPVPLLNFLVEGEDYEIIYSDNIEAGTGLVTINGIGSFNGTVTKEFTIKKNIEYCEASLEYYTIDYTGEEMTPLVTIEGLIEGTDFEVCYVSNIKAGTAKVIINGIGEYGGSLVKSFKILSDDVANYDYGEITEIGSVDNIVWTFYEDGTLVFEGEGEMPDYSYERLPNNSLGGLTPVRFTNPPWSKYYEDVRKIIFSEGITAINKDLVFWEYTSSAMTAVWNQARLTIDELVLPSTLTSIGEEAFSYVFVEDVVIPSKVKTIGKQAFYCNIKLKNITLSNELETIGELSFAYCENLEQIKFSENLKEIGYNAFWFCEKLKSIECPDSLKNIGKNAFQYCYALEEFTFNKNIESMGEGVFSGCKSLKEISWPATIPTIPRDTFISCKQLESVNIPEGVETIEIGSFQYCYNLKSIELPSSMRTIKTNAFWGDESLKEVKLNEGLERIEHSAFNGCPINYIRISGSVTYIGAGVLADANTVFFDNGEGELVLNAYTFFDGYDSNVEKIVFSKNVSKVGVAVYNPLNVYVDYVDYLIQINDADVYYYRDTFVDELYHRQPYVTSVGIIEVDGKFYTTAGGTEMETNYGGTYIVDHDHCGEYTDYLITEDGELQIFGEGDMYDYENVEDTPWYSYADTITSVQIEDGVTSIGDNSFKGLKKLTDVTIADSVTTIGENAFVDCESLNNVSLSESIASVEKSSFDDKDSLEISCSIGSKAHIYIYKNYKNVVINAIPGICGDNTQWTIDKEGTLNILGEGEMFDYQKGKAPWYTFRTSINKVIISDGVTSVGSNAFFGCAKLTNVEGLDYVESIGENAFSQCINIKELSLENINTIKSYAFEGCKRLNSVILGDQLEELNISCFNDCTALLEIELPQSLIDIYDAGKYTNSSTVYVINKDDMAQEIFDLYNIQYRFVGEGTEEDIITEGGLHINQNISVLGCQISAHMIDDNGNRGGLRVISQVEPTIRNLDVEKVGYVVALNSYGDVYNDILDDEIYYGSDNEYIKSFESTSKGILSEKMGDSDTATYYALTISLGGLNDLSLSAAYKYRVYALLSDGTYVYSDVKTYSIESISKKIYDQSLMSTLEGHEFIYNNILSIIDPTYEVVDYNWNQTIVA